MSVTPSNPPPTHCILFYTYTPLSSDVSSMSLYRDIVDVFTTSLGLRGRLLIGSSINEGVNGSFSGDILSLNVYIHSNCLEYSDVLTWYRSSVLSSRLYDVISNFIKVNYKSFVIDDGVLREYILMLHDYYVALINYHNDSNTNETMNNYTKTFTPFTIQYNEFKWSDNTTVPRRHIFPDLNIKVSFF
jgi:hypothetical protein